MTSTGRAFIIRDGNEILNIPQKTGSSNYHNGSEQIMNKIIHTSVTEELLVSNYVSLLSSKNN